MQLRDTGPALTFCRNTLWNPEASLYHMTRNIHINFTVRWLKHLVSTLLRSFWNEKHKQRFWLIIKIKRLTMNCVVLETMYWFPTSKSYELLTTRATDHTLEQSLEQSQAPFPLYIQTFLSRGVSFPTPFYSSQRHNFSICSLVAVVGIKYCLLLLNVNYNQTLCSNYLKNCIHLLTLVNIIVPWYN